MKEKGKQRKYEKKIKGMYVYDNLIKNVGENR